MESFVTKDTGLLLTNSLREDFHTGELLGAFRTFSESRRTKMSTCS